MTRKLYFFALLFLATTAAVRSASAQIVEAVGSRALGMGGAFVAVADDSSATWWNPAGLATGPFIDLALAQAVTSVKGTLPARRDRTTSFTLSTPVIGFSYYRLQLTDIQPFDPTAAPPGDREDRRAGVPVRSLSASQLGVTLLQTLFPGVHIGTTVKYVRGTARSAREDGLLEPSELLDRGEDLAGGDAEGTVDLDVGLLAVGGPVRVGLVVRNVREPELGDRVLPRQARVGVALDGEPAGFGPTVLALDADVRPYETGSGERRVIAVGVERWFAMRRVGVRGGARFNTAGAADRAATGGLSITARAGLFIDAHVVRGGGSDERGWGLAARVSF